MDDPRHFYPDHIQGFVVDASGRFLGEADAWHHYYQVLCKCGGFLFRVYLGDKCSVKARCTACNTEVLIYDRSRYPASTKRPGPEEFRPLTTADKMDTTKTLVMYEYPEFEQDVPFNSNDITWFGLWLENGKGELELLVNDETA